MLKNEWTVSALLLIGLKSPGSPDWGFGCYLVTNLRLTLCNPMACSPPGSSAHGISQARILEWVAISFSRDLPDSRDWTCISCTAGGFFTWDATREAQGGGLAKHWLWRYTAGSHPITCLGDPGTNSLIALSLRFLAVSGNNNPTTQGCFKGYKDDIYIAFSMIFRTEQVLTK